MTIKGKDNSITTVLLLRNLCQWSLQAKGRIRKTFKSAIEGEGLKYCCYKKIYFKIHEDKINKKNIKDIKKLLLNERVY